MASAAARDYNWVWARSPQQGSRAEPPVGVRVSKPPEADEVFVFKTVISNASATVFARNDVLFELLLLI